jgi:hypothetical protein
MMARAIFMLASKPFAEYPIKINGPGDLGDGSRFAFEAFRKPFPDVSFSRTMSQ